MSLDIQIATAKVASVNPATGEMLQQFDCYGEAEVQAAVKRARAAQAEWGARSLRERLGVIRRFQRMLVEEKSEVARLITREAGKPYFEALTTEVLVVLDAARFLAENAYGILQDEPVPHGSLATRLKRGKLLREPYGVVGIVSPWNYPFSIAGTDALAALAAGNAVVLKPSEFTTLTGFKLAQLLRAAGVPEGAMQVVPGNGATGAALVHSSIDKLIFTGSVATGKRVAQAAAARLLPTVLELGGKDPMLVLDDAEIDVASSAAVWGGLVNAGQACLSVERCYVHRNLYQRFLESCVRKAASLRVGNGAEAETDMGPMIHAGQLQIAESQVEDARMRGARILLGGTRLPHLGRNFYAPTILAEVNHTMRVMREETFGPVLPVMAFENDEEAIRLANDTEFGLSASVWTRDARRGEAIARKIAAGTVMVNDTVSCFGISEAPHGGVKSSGVGRSHGRLGLEEMVRTKYVDRDLLPRMKKPWWFGYGEKLARGMEGFLDLQYAERGAARLRGAVRAAGVLRGTRL